MNTKWIAALMLGLSLAATAPARAQCPGAPTVVEDFGTLTPSIALNRSVTMTGGGVRWYKFNLPFDVEMATLTYLNIQVNTAGTTSGMMTELGLYDCQGTLMATDDNDAGGDLSALTFGSGSPTRPNNTGYWNNGRDGRLPNGTYYLSVSQNNSLFALTGWGVTPGTNQIGTASITILLSNATPATPPAGAIDLGAMSQTDVRHRVADTLAANQVRWYKVTVPASNLNPGRYWDIDTEGSLMSGTNATRLAVYNTTGVISGTQWPYTKENLIFNITLQDLDDGNNNLSQISLGVGTRPAVGFGLPYSGRDGDLQAGTYYIGVAGPGNSPSSTAASGINFGFTSNSATSGTINLNLATGVGPVPLQGVGTALPAIVQNGGSSSSLLRVTVTPATSSPGPSTGITVSANLSTIGLANPQQFYDDGTHGDASAADGIYSFNAPIANTVTTGAKTLAFTVSDAQLRSANGGIALTVIEPPPANDTCANATTVGLGSYPFTTLWALNDAQTVNCGGSGPDIYFRFTPTFASIYSITTCGSSYDTGIAILPACGSPQLACNSSADPACPGNPNHAALNIPLDAGVPYIIQMDGDSGEKGQGVLNIGIATVPFGIASHTIPARERTDVLLWSTVSPANPPFSTGIAVSADLTSLGGPASLPLYDDGTHGDVTAGDYVFSSLYPLPLSAVSATYPVPVVATDEQLRTASGNTWLEITDGVRGACCNAGTCALSRETLCAAAGGTYLGNHVSCGTGYVITQTSQTFQDLSMTGGALSTVSTSDDATVAQALPFAFPYLGNTYTSVRVCTNGNLQFGPAFSSTYENAPIPTPSSPNNLLAPLWDDLDLRAIGEVFYQNDPANGRVFFSWQSCPQFGTSDSNNFQILLYQTGAIEFRYGAIAAINNPAPYAGDTVTIGYEDLDGDTGAEISPLNVGSGHVSFLLSPIAPTNPCAPVCDPIDFNADGLYPDSTDIDDFLSVFSGGPCSTGSCSDLDFNNDGLYPDTLDIDSLLSVFSGGACL